MKEPSKAVVTESSVVMVPAGTAPSKIIQARAYGATVVVIDGDFDYDVAKLYKAALQEFGWYDCLSFAYINIKCYNGRQTILWRKNYLSFIPQI